METQVVRQPSVKWRVVAIVIALVVLALAAFGIQALLNRPGERALGLVPSDSSMFLSIDLAPSPGQVGVFNDISQALKRFRLDAKIQDGITGMLSQDPTTHSIAPYLGHGGAFALLPDPGDTQASQERAEMFPTNWVVIVGLTNPQKAESALENASPSENFQGLKFHRLQSGGLIAIIKGNVVTAQKQEALYRISQVASGAIKSVVDSPAYVQARAKLDPDANLMYFMDSSALDQLNSKNPSHDVGQLQARLLKGLKWVAYGVAVRDTGLSLSFAEGVDQSQSGWLADMAKVPSLRSDILNILPSGAFGAVATAGPAAYIRAMEDGMGDFQGGKPIREAKEALKQATGLNADADLVPALQGDAVIAVYPSSDPTNQIPDMLMVLDDKNGGDPSAIVPKLREALEREWHEHDSNQPLFEPEEVEGVQAYKLSSPAYTALNKNSSSANVFGGPGNGGPGNGGRGNAELGIDAQGQKDLEKAMAKMIKDQQAEMQANSGSSTHRMPPGHFAEDYDRAMRRVQAESAARSHRAPVGVLNIPYYAIIGKNVIVASSRTILKRAIDSFKNGTDSMAGDTVYQSLSSQVAGNSCLSMMSFSRIATAMEKATMGEMKGDSKNIEMTRRFFSFFESIKEPAYFTGQISGDLYSGKGVVPMKIGRLIEIIGDAMHEFLPDDSQPTKGDA